MSIVATTAKENFIKTVLAGNSCPFDVSSAITIIILPPSSGIRRIIIFTQLLAVPDTVFVRLFKERNHFLIIMVVVPVRCCITGSRRCHGLGGQLHWHSRDKHDEYQQNSGNHLQLSFHKETPFKNVFDSLASFSRGYRMA